jgi:cholesterol transport system auxiliary component
MELRRCGLDLMHLGSGVDGLIVRSSASAARGGGAILSRLAGGLLALAMTGLLAGCGGAAPETFDLSAPSGGFAARSPRGLLVIAEPGAAAPADSDRIVVRTGPESVAYLKGAQWADRLPRLVQTRLVQSFDNAKLMRSVARPEDGLSADFKLVSDIRRFEVDAQTNEAVIEIAAKLVADRTGRIVAGEIFTVRTPGSAADGPAASHALDAALSQVLRQIVSWAAARV